MPVPTADEQAAAAERLCRTCAHNADWRNGGPPRCIYHLRPLDTQGRDCVYVHPLPASTPKKNTP
jgi:hypothetical protein